MQSSRSLGLTRRSVIAAGLALASVPRAAFAACDGAFPAAKTLYGGLNFPENPRWHDGALWFSDIHDHKIFRAGPDGKLQTVASVGDRVSGLGFMPDGTLLAVSMLDRKLLAIGRGGAISVHADVAPLCKSFINDMIVDGQGRAYVGCRNGGAPETASDSLILVTPDGRAGVAATMTSPNGSAITADGRHLIVAETAVGRLIRFRIGADGTLSERTVIADVSPRHIDGLAMDAGGAFWGGGGEGGLLRIGADGALRRVIPFPGRMVIACALGGPDLRTLYLTTTSPRLLENLKRIGSDRTLDAAVNSDGRIEAISLDNFPC